ncbi:MAG: response regulator transcription factor [Chloroflexi bacterium]|nr:response regulator transcription factor [Chloroflexota bacterium]
MEDIRIFIVDDHPLMRHALRSAVEIELGMKVVGEAANGKQALEDLQLVDADVVIMDLYMPVMDGITAIKELLLVDPKLKMMVITSSNEDEKVLEAVHSGALGYVLKDAPRENLIEGIREIAAGRRYIPAAVGEKLVNALKFQERRKMLTLRESEVFDLIGKGFSNKEIAEKMGISAGTLRVHISNIVGKLKLFDRHDVELLAKHQLDPK